MLVDDQIELPSLPAVVVRLNELLASRLPSMGQVAELVGEDPALAARVLKLVNSPLYPFRGKIDSVQRAVAMIGVRELRSLALAVAVPKLFEGFATPLITLEQFWRHSLCVALLSRGLAEAAQQRELDRYFTTGLLHDLGALILYSRRPQQAAEAAARSRAERKPLDEAEREVIGFSHADLGGELMRRWGLPDVIVAAVLGHHERPAQGEHRLTQGIVHLANQLAGLIPDGALGIGFEEGVGISDWEQINVHPRAQDALVAAAKERLDATRQALFDGAASPASSLYA